MIRKTTFAQDLAVFKNVRALTVTAMLIALSVVIGIICKMYLTFFGWYRFTLENMPIFFAAILFGPFVAGAAAVIADILSCVIAGGAPIPLISVGAFLVGFVAGMISHHISFKKPVVCLLCTVVFGHLIGQVLVKGLAKCFIMGMPWFGIFISLGFSVVAGAIEFYVLSVLIKNPGILGSLKKVLK